MDTLLGKQVALKLLKSSLVDTIGDFVTKRFEQEVAVCAALKSDHIVQVSDYGVTDQGQPFFVMEYLQGETLRQRLDRQGRLPVRQAIAILVQVCAGLQVAHEGITLWRDGATSSELIKVIHRDLKPDNVFLVPTVLGELAKLLDFGIAKVFHAQAGEHTALTAINTFVGTPRYAAPEHLGGEQELDGRADIYSLGMILYEMLTGTDPFGLTQKKHTTRLAWTMAHTAQPPKSLRSQPGCEHLYPELEAVVLRCLQKDPDQRFATVQELSRALQAVIAAYRTEETLIGVPEVELEPVSTGSTERTVADPSHTPNHRTPAPPEKPVEVATRQQPAQTRISGPTETRPNQDSPSATTENRPKPDALPIPRETATSQPWMLWAGIIGGAIAAIAASAYFYWSWQAEVTARKQLQAIQALRDQQDYQGCINSSTAYQSSKFQAEVQTFLNQCLLGQAQQLETNSKFSESMAVASRIAQTDPVYPEAQKLVERLSKRLVQEATQLYEQGQFQQAFSLIEPIPKTSATGKSAHAKVEQWRKDTAANQAVLTNARQALAEKRWQEAIQEASQLKPTPYWTQQRNAIIQEASAHLPKRDSLTIDICQPGNSILCPN
jgi:serine/threonine-protein kinase